MAGEGLKDHMLPGEAGSGLDEDCPIYRFHPLHEARPGEDFEADDPRDPESQLGPGEL